MTESLYERINKVLTWKRIIAFNFVLLLVLIVPLSVRLAQLDTENRSNAAGEGVMAASPTPQPNYPKGLPTIERVSTFYGKIGDSIILMGNNFGDYQWGSKVYVGSMEAPKADVVSWKNSIIEVRIPSGARTGNVWVNINGQQASWEGKLLLYDATRASKVGIEKETSTAANLWVEKGESVASGMIELSYVTEPLKIGALSGVNIANQTQGADILGKKIKIEFATGQSLSRSRSPILALEHPAIGNIEIIRVELKDRTGNLIEVYSDPLAQKLVP